MSNLIRATFQLTLIITLIVGATNVPVKHGTSSSLPDGSPRELLVSSVIDNAEVLAAAAAEDVLVIRYETERADLESLLGLVRDALGGRKAASIGFAAHDFGEARFYLTGSETISLGSTQASESQREFWSELGSMLAENGRIDLFACNLASGREGLMLVSALEEVSGVDVAASTDRTGNVTSGGDWILETDEINLAALYFSQAELGRFSGLLTSHAAKLTASDAGIDDAFGYAVSLAGDYVVVGAMYDDDAGSNSGSAYIFYRNQGGADNWGQVKKLTASDAASGDQFGLRVAISGDYIVVSARWDDDTGSNSGSAYVFYRNHGGADNWGEVKKITASDAASGDEFGYRVSISGDYVIVGARYDDDGGSNSGSAYVFYRNHGGADNWGQVAKLTASDADLGDEFGYSVSISGDYAIVGGPCNDDVGGNSGAAYVFYRNQGGADNWGQMAKLTASDAGTGDAFGYSVSLAGNYAVVGAHGNDDEFIDSGSAYIFYRNQGGADNWGQVKKLTTPEATYGYFGFKVSIYGDYTLVSAIHHVDDTGSGYIFYRNQGGADNWGQVAKINASDAASGDRFGWAVSIYGDYAVIGSHWDDDVASNSGSAYIFECGPVCTYGPPEQPLTFSRERGSPIIEIVEWDSCGGNGALVIANNGVRSAEIYLNGELVVGPNRLHKKVTTIIKFIELFEGYNMLEVELRGKPGRTITLEFVPEQ